MGGNSIKDAERMTRDEFDEMCNMLLSLDPTIKITLAFKDKGSFGDIDAIVLDKIPDLSSLNITEIRKNGNVTSFGIKPFQKIHQVDFFVTGTLEKQMHLQAYLSYGIFGMCVGICLNKLGLEYGIDGLKLVDPKLTLSTDRDKIFKFLALDLAKFLAGFTDSNDFFDFVFESPYISYNTLMKKLATKEGSRLSILRDYKYVEKCIPPLLNIKNISLEYFGKQEVYDQLCAKIEQDADNARKFNGNIVMEVTKLSGKDLGRFIAEFKMEYVIDTMTQDDILLAIKNKYSQGNNSIDI